MGGKRARNFRVFANKCRVGWFISLFVGKKNNKKHAKISGIYVVEVQDKTKKGLQDDSCKGLPTTKGQKFGLWTFWICLDLPRCVNFFCSP